MLNRVILNNLNYAQKPCRPVFKAAGRIHIGCGETKNSPVKGYMVTNFGIIADDVNAEENLFNHGEITGNVAARSFFCEGENSSVTGNITAHKVKLEGTPHIMGNITITDDDNEEGKFTLWYVKDAKIDGEIIYLDKDGKIKRKQKYENGKLIQTYPIFLSQ